MKKQLLIPTILMTGLMAVPLVIGKGRDTSILDDVITINVKFNKPCNLMIPVSSVSK